MELHSAISEAVAVGRQGGRQRLSKTSWTLGTLTVASAPAARYDGDAMPFTVIPALSSLKNTQALS